MTNLFWEKQVENSKHVATKRAFTRRSGTKQKPWILTYRCLESNGNGLVQWPDKFTFDDRNPTAVDVGNVTYLIGFTCLKSQKLALNFKARRNGSSKTQSTTNIPTLVKQKPDPGGSFWLVPYISHHPCSPEQMKASAKSLWRPDQLSEGPVEGG